MSIAVCPHCGQPPAECRCGAPGWPAPPPAPETDAPRGVELMRYQRRLAEEINRNGGQPE